MKKISIVCFLFLLFICVRNVFAEGERLVILQWDAVDFGAEALVVDCGYKLYIGITSRNYDQEIDIHCCSTMHSVMLVPDNYYFAVTAYNKNGESDYSKEFNYIVEPLPPQEPPETPVIITIQSATLTINENP